jgi:protein-S-isoprenylcysteine O-methyltransferase Ste14
LNVDVPTKGNLLNGAVLTFRSSAQCHCKKIASLFAVDTRNVAIRDWGKMAIATVAERLKALRRSKLYDLFAAAPLMAWYAFCAAQMLPSLAQRVALVKLFVQTDLSVIPATLVFSTVSELSTLAFLVLLVVMFAVRHIPQRAALGFYPRFAAAAGTFLSVGFLLLPAQELSYALHLASLLLVIAGTVFAICALLVLGRSISLLPEARRLVTRGPYALVRHPLYLGEMVAIAGVALQYLSAWALLLLGLVWAFQLQRMKYEELVLFQSFPEYGEYMARTARLVPGVY